MKKTKTKSNDSVNNPSHYTKHPSGIECIDVTEHYNFNRGNAIKYLWRAGEKNPDKEIEDLEKACWYIKREIQRIRRFRKEPLNGTGRPKNRINRQ